MHDTLALMPAGAAGLVLGATFFGGLWWTVRKGASSTQPAWWFFGSLLLRTIIVLAGFYGVSGGQAKPLLSCLFGFVVARLVVTWLIGSTGADDSRMRQEGSHAPQS